MVPPSQLDRRQAVRQKVKHPADAAGGFQFGMGGQPDGQAWQFQFRQYAHHFRLAIADQGLVEADAPARHDQMPGGHLIVGAEAEELTLNRNPGGAKALVV